jgi:hypothetical protein|nr:MAG TPA: hypothetical protein [Caudoviricetes sp.]
MKDFLYNTFIAPFEDRCYFIGILLWISGLLVFGLVLWGTLYLTDSTFLPEKQDKGVIVSKGYIPAHFQTTYIQSGKILVPITNYIPTIFQITIEINSLTDKFNLNEISYNSLEVGDTLNCRFTNGRLFNSIYIEEISW